MVFVGPRVRIIDAPLRAAAVTNDSGRYRNRQVDGAPPTPQRPTSLIIDNHGERDRDSLAIETQNAEVMGQPSW